MVFINIKEIKTYFDHLLSIKEFINSNITLSKEELDLIMQRADIQDYLYGLYEDQELKNTIINGLLIETLTHNDLYYDNNYIINKSIKWKDGWDGHTDDLFELFLYKDFVKDKDKDKDKDNIIKQLHDAWALSRLFTFKYKSIKNEIHLELINLKLEETTPNIINLDEITDTTFQTNNSKELVRIIYSGIDCIIQNRWLTNMKTFEALDKDEKYKDVVPYAAFHKMPETLASSIRITTGNILGLSSWYSQIQGGQKRTRFLDLCQKYIEYGKRT